VHTGNKGAVDIPGSGFHYPHETIESTGAHLTQHSQTLHNIASSVGGTSLPSSSLGSIGAQHASTLSSHFSSASSHVSSVAEKEAAHGDRLRQTSQNMRATDQNAAQSFSSIQSHYDEAKLPGGQGGANGASTHGAGQSTQPSSSEYRPPDIKAHNTNPSANDTPTDSRPTFADPIDVTTGRMMLSQVDVELGGALPLLLSRTHVSSYALGRWFGASWASTIDQRLEVDDDGVYFAAEDGTLLTFPRPVVDGPVQPLSGPRWELSLSDDGSYAITKPETGQLLFFAPAGGNRLPITGIADANGNWIRFVHDGDALTEILHSGGYRIAVVTADGVITALRLTGEPAAEDVDLVRYEYTDGRLTGVVNSSGQPLRYEYDDAGRVVRWIDRNGMWYRYTFDAHGQCVRAEGADGYLDATFAYDRENLVTSATNSLGHTTRFQLNDRLRVVGNTDPLGNVTRFEWDKFDHLLARTDPLGRTTRYTYDEAGNLTGETMPDGTRRIAEYGTSPLPLTVVDPDGAVWRREFDDAGRIVAEIDPVGTRTTYGYDDAGHLATVTNGLGGTTHIESNTAGLPVAVTDTLGATTRYTYDRFGRVRTVTDPLGGVTTWSRTVEGLPVANTTPNGATRRWSYDGEGNVTEAVDEQGQRTRTEIAHFDLPVAELSPDGTELRYEYDTDLRLTEVTNQQGNRWRYEYDAAGQLVRETDFDGRETRYRYDAAGQLIERTNAVGQTVVTSWDPLGRPAVTRVDGVETAFAYDPAGRMIRARNADADMAFEYDRLGRLVAETVNGRTLRSTYDALGRRISRRTPSGALSEWRYDAEGRPAALNVAGHAMAFRRDPVGREIERRMGGTALATTWDANHRLTSQTVTSQPVSGPSRRLQDRRYGYREDGILATVNDQLSGDRRYEIDRAGRVTAVHGNGPAERYAYDPVGNITQPTGAVRYEHDAEGRAVARHRDGPDGRPQTWHYTWDGENHLAAVATPDGQHWRYRYDPLGRRIAKQRLSPDGQVAEQVDFTWDGDELVEQVHNGSHALVWDWAPNSNDVISQLERSANGQQWIDQRFFAIVTDLVGAPTELVDEQGNLAWHLRTTLWGALVSQPGGAYTPLRFPGQYHDAETGLHYNFHRYYDPVTGRYTSHDPLGLAGGINTRAYVTNPTGWVDPLGLTPCPVAELHKNPQGTAIKFHNPAWPTLGKSNDPNNIKNTPNTKTWNTIASDGKTDKTTPASLKPSASIKQDGQTWSELHPGASDAAYSGNSGMNQQGITGVRKSAILESMGRRDSETQPYWQKQDGRDERTAQDAANFANNHNARPQGTDANAVNGNTKLQGMQNLLQNHDGVIIGTKHGSDEAHPFLINNMQQLKNSGVNTLYMENIRDDGHQELINKYESTGRMDPGLQQYLQRTGQLNTVTAAHDAGVHVQGLGGRPGRSPDNLVGPAATHARASMLNSYGSSGIQVYQNQAGGKWIAEVGRAHTTTHNSSTPDPVEIQGVPLPQTMPGMSDILHAPTVVTDPGNGDNFTLHA
jgi:RHS repeat-associated protein